MPGLNRRNICAVLTSPGRGAVSVIALAGHQCETTLNQLFYPVGSLSFVQVKSPIVYGVWGESTEDLVVIRLPHENEFEIHCHGGMAASRKIIQALNAHGIDEVDAFEFEAIKMDPWVHSTDLAIQNAPTPKSCALLSRQRNVLPRVIGQLASHLEMGETQSAIEIIDQLVGSFDVTRRLLEPARIVICGKPNVGKSSLINALVGFQRAIVHDVPGTTRDVVTQVSAIDGWPVELSDTAGIRETENEIEALGVSKAKMKIENADLVIAVFDLAQPWSSRDQDFIDKTRPGIIVWNKVDLSSKLPANQPSGLMVSAKQSIGLEKLIREIGTQISPSPERLARPILTSRNQFDRLNEVARLIRGDDRPKAVQLLRDDFPIKPGSR